MQTLQFTAPPLPHYITSGLHTNKVGQIHPGRRNINVFDLLLVKKGTLFMEEEQETFEVRENHALILLPDRYHSGTKPGLIDTEYYWLHFQTEGMWTTIHTNHHLQSVKEEQPKPPHSAFLTRTFHLYVPQFTAMDQPQKAFDLIDQLTSLNEGLNMHQIRWQQQVLFQELLQRISASMQIQTTNTSRQCAELAAAYLRRHYQEEITAAQLGENTNFHPVYIARCMHRQFGCSPMEYLQRYRIDQSKLLLLQTDYSIARVAEEVGFNQGAYFTSCFTKFEGISPSKYRQRFR
ncbi:AraC family transcriptional regulator [Paenibacillus selenitireducens]|uniref:AraC family transcriptional regulator n=1 Tax=Paenibacillus selenitireducens TaxID=1324314 RepID=A0A1T2X028_9BACL|nr:AraC family transcriptional regulator [Paenibacillus selenitireducens]OPA73227.1 AraC family transcriptional regulator [Paenibacillus selenitireducens]